jgi:hypothetical protein
MSDAKDNQSSDKTASVEEAQLPRDVYALVLLFGICELTSEY